MEVKCYFCKKNTPLNQQEEDFILSMRQKGAPFAMIRCKHCRELFGVDPSTLRPLEEEESEVVWRTPISGFNGFVSLIEDDCGLPCYGCGETGVIWKTKAAFYRDIEKIISRYPHRALFYEKKEGDWLPVEEEPIVVDELIFIEKEEEITNYES